MNIAAERPVECSPGCASRSTSSTLPRGARRHASEAPAMPAPNTATSNSLIREFSHERILVVHGGNGQVTMAASRSTKTAVPDPARMGLRLREIRKAHGLTLKELSQRSGVALSTLSKMELGQITVSYEKLAAAARGL